MATYLEAQFRLCGKTQVEISDELGFPKPNMLSMIKSGKAKLPMEKVGLMAKAVGVDPLFLFNLVMNEYHPITWRTIQQAVLKQPLITQNEIALIHTIRQSKVKDPGIRTDVERARLLDVINTFTNDK